MVQGVRETIAVLCDFKAGADAAALQEKLIDTFVNLLESVLIELEYSVAISSSSLVVRPPGPPTPATAPACFTPAIPRRHLRLFGAPAGAGLASGVPVPPVLRGNAGLALDALCAYLALAGTSRPAAEQHRSGTLPPSVLCTASAHATTGRLPSCSRAPAVLGGHAAVRQ